MSQLVHSQVSVCVCSMCVCVCVCACVCVLLTFIFLRQRDRLSSRETLSSRKVLRSSLKPSLGNFFKAYWYLWAASFTFPFYTHTHTHTHTRYKRLVSTEYRRTSTHYTKERTPHCAGPLQSVEVSNSTNAEFSLCDI